MKNEILKIDAPELQVIEKNRAEQIKATFEPMADMLSQFEVSYKSILDESGNEITKEITAKAKRLRLDIGKVRIETGKLKDKQKEYIKLEDKAIMGVHNILVWAVKEKEDTLKKIEDYFEIQEEKRLESLQSERAEKLSVYVEDAYERNLSGMDEDVWVAYFESKKKQHEDRIVAENKAEEDRIAKELADEQERTRIKKENERLKKEAEKKEREDVARKVKEDKERKAQVENQRKEREAYEDKLKAEREAKERIEREEKAKREKLEAELKAKKDAEHKAKMDEDARIQAELNKGDSAKVKDLVSDLTSLKAKYSFKSNKNQKVYSEVGILIDKIIKHIQ